MSGSCPIFDHAYFVCGNHDFINLIELETKKISLEILNRLKYNRLL